MIDNQTIQEREAVMLHYQCLIDISSEPFYCSEHEVYLKTNGEEL